MRPMLLVLLSLGVLAALEGVYHLLLYLSQRKDEELRRRLHQLAAADARDAGLLRKERYAKDPRLDALVRVLPGARACERLLAEADVGLTVAGLWTYSLLAGAAAAGLPLSLGVAAPAAVLPGLLGLVTPALLVFVARDRRSARVSEQLPEALDMMTRSLRSGHSLPAAFRLVASEMPTPICVEFGRAYEEQRLGLGVEEAVVNLTARCPLNRDLKIFAVSIAVQRETGGNLAEVFENIAATIRDRYRFFAKLRSLTAEGRTSGLVLGTLPLFMVGFLSLTKPVYLSRLFEDRAGQMILAYAIVSWVIGALWMHRMTKVDY